MWPWPRTDRQAAGSSEPDPLKPSVALGNAGCLLEHAASEGVLAAQGAAAASANQQMIRSVLEAHEAAHDGATGGRLSADQAISFWLAYDRLSALVKPVTAHSLESSRRVSLVRMKISAFAFVFTVIVASIYLFMCNTTLKETSDLIDAQNAAALKLWSDVQMLKIGSFQGSALDSAAGAPMAAGVESSVAVERVFDDIVEFSRKNSWLLQSASRLNYWFLPMWMEVSPEHVVFNKKNPDKLDHLNVPPEIHGVQEIEAEALFQITAYQNIRDYALGLGKINELIFTSLSTYLLPTVYALLGAYLYGFRFYSRLIRQKQYVQSAAHSARYYIAAISGLVVGLFGSLLPKDFVLPPLAVAFLFGYAVEALFSWLDELIRKFRTSTEQLMGRQPDVPSPQPAE